MTTNRKMPTVQEIAPKMIPLVRAAMTRGLAYSSAFSSAADACSDDIERTCLSTARGIGRMIELSSMVAQGVEA